MKTVEYVPVLNTVYSISLIPDNDEGYDGLCDTEIKTICIIDTLSEERMKRVVLHELMHAFMFESGMCEFLDQQTEEMVCQSASGFLNGILEWKIKATTLPMDKKN